MAAANSKRHGGTDDRTQLTQHIGQLVQHLGPDAMLLAGLDDDQLVSGVLVIKHRRHLFVRLVGFDYDRTPGTFSYFVLMFLAPTILHEDLDDIDDVHLGVGALGTKLLHGARPEPLSTWIYDPQYPAMSSDEVARANGPRIEASLSAAGGTGRRSMVKHSIAALEAIG